MREGSRSRAPTDAVAAGDEAKDIVLTAQECTYWLAIAWSRGWALECGAAICAAAEGDVGMLRDEAESFMTNARLDGSMSRPLRRQYLVAWALCRQAIRAIRREEGQPGASPET